MGYFNVFSKNTDIQLFIQEGNNSGSAVFTFFQLEASDPNIIPTTTLLHIIGCTDRASVQQTMEDVTLTPVAATLQQDPLLAPVIKVTTEMNLLVMVCQLLKEAYVLSWVLRD